METAVYADGKFRRETDVVTDPVRWRWFERGGTEEGNSGINQGGTGPDAKSKYSESLD